VYQSHDSSGAREIVTCRGGDLAILSSHVPIRRRRLVLDEAEALLDMDGRRERLELAVTDLQSGRIQPVGHATAREQIEKRIRDCRTR
jgi:hypothetical protein